MTTALRPADDRFVAAAKRGDRRAYDELVERYQDRLYTTLARLLGSAHDAEDVAQDAFVQAYLKLDSFAGKSAFYTWLYRIAFNLAMSHARKRRPTTLASAGADAAALDPPDEVESPADALERQEQVADVQAAIDSLADEHRQVVVLRELEGCDYEQIAAILEIPIGTVRSRLYRARMQLKERLASVVE